MVVLKWSVVLIQEQTKGGHCVCVCGGVSVVCGMC